MTAFNYKSCYDLLLLFLFADVAGVGLRWFFLLLLMGNCRVCLWSTEAALLIYLAPVKSRWGTGLGRFSRVAPTIKSRYCRPRCRLWSLSLNSLKTSGTPLGSWVASRILLPLSWARRRCSLTGTDGKLCLRLVLGRDTPRTGCLCAKDLNLQETKSHWFRCSA